METEAFSEACEPKGGERERKTWKSVQVLKVEGDLLQSPAYGLSPAQRRLRYVKPVL